MVAIALAFLCIRESPPLNDASDLAVLVILGAAGWWLPAADVGGRASAAASDVVTLAAVAILGPFGAGLVGLTTGVFRRGQWRVRWFNAVMGACSAMSAGLVYTALGGFFDSSNLRGLDELSLRVGGPLVVAGAVFLVINALLLSGIVRLSNGIPVRLQLISLMSGTGLTQLGYAVIAFIVVILWMPAGMEEVSVLVVLAPLMGARWALLLYGEERHARERALGALVAAIETRDPSLEGHSGRVSTLAAGMAQDLGLGPQAVADVRTAGLLHDLGRVVVAPGTEGPGAEAAAQRGLAMLRDLPFLEGASAVMSEVALPGSKSLGAEIVHAADDFDLMRMGPDAVPAQVAISRLRDASGPGHEAVLDALIRVATLRESQVDEVGV
ncbi:HD domain-containing protein [Knoellia sp. S7-12]|uniref:HD-GYP domain-containing protein n=1 Tax=Knoellia sp. S7-12 TaxID=3126698 RepID=UPI003366561A